MTTTPKPVLRVDPADALIDVPRRIVAEQLPPNANVELTATSIHADGTVWRSAARFQADGQGRLDLSSTAPVTGDYDGVDAGGLLWSLALSEGKEAVRSEESIDPRTIRLAILAKEGAAATEIAAAELTQRLIAPGVVRREVQENGIVGTLFTPASPGPHPVVIVLNGSGGGINEARAALYAAHGFASLALGYFGAPGLKPYIGQTSLSYFEAALNWIHDSLRPCKGFVAISGQSRGAELALLLAAEYPDLVRSVIAYVPSHVVHGTLRAGAPGEDPTAPAWIRGEEPLTTVWQDNREADWSAFLSKDSPVRQSPSFSSALRDAEAVARARIPVERIVGSVLLISGTDDGFWPSSDMSDAIVAQLRVAEHAYPVEHLRYQDAGHAIQFPFVPTTRIVKAHAVAKVDLTGGGTPAANAHANADSWPRVLAFLRTAAQ